MAPGYASSPATGGGLTIRAETQQRLCGSVSAYLQVFAVQKSDTDILLPLLTPLRSGGQGAIFTGLWQGRKVAFKIIKKTCAAARLEVAAVRAALKLCARSSICGKNG